MAANAPAPGMPVDHLPQQDLLQNNLFGLEHHYFNVPMLKSLLNAFGVRGFSRGRRQELLDRVQILEIACTNAQRATVAWLVKNEKLISRDAIAAGIPPTNQVSIDAATSPLVRGAQGISNQGSRECEICVDSKEVTEFPIGKITPQCDHLSTICKKCWTTDINIQIQNKQWDLVKCMVCSAILPTDTVKAYTTPIVFERFNDFVTSWHMKDIRNFRWCHNPDCSSGQVYPSALQRRVVCLRCGHANCHKCRIIWHEGKSCKVSTRERLAMLEPDEQTELMIATTTNMCPACNAQVERSGGCQHMTCRCGNHFTWHSPATNADKLPPLLSAPK